MDQKANRTLPHRPDGVKAATTRRQVGPRRARVVCAAEQTANLKSLKLLSKTHGTTLWKLLMLCRFGSPCKAGQN